jgi:ABC-type uncharacterized transport system substrate-binding protein
LAVGNGTVTLSGEAKAHPHDTLEVMVAPSFDLQGRLVSVGETWTFGYDYTDVAKIQLDDNRDGSVDQAELDAAFDYVLAWIPESDFFTRITVAGKPIGHGPATGLSVGLTSDKLVVQFVLPLKAPSRVTSAGIDVFDNSFYYAMEFAYPDIDLSTAPASCRIDRRWSPNIDLTAPPTAPLSDPAEGYAVRVQIECAT